MAVSPVPAAKRKAATEKLQTSRKAGPAAADDLAAPRKRMKDPGVRVIGGRIYDSQNGKTCHQCRQKTMDFAAPCKNERKEGKTCPISFCHKCLLNRYGENAEEVAKLEDWSCPKCRAICNCSFCMKKKGHEPTGILVRTAKAIGFDSVSELLHHTGPGSVKELITSSAKSPLSSVESAKQDEKKKSDLGVDARALQCDEGAKDNAKRQRKRKLKLETSAVGDQHEAPGDKTEKVNKEGLVPMEVVNVHKTDDQKELHTENFLAEDKKKSTKLKKVKVEKKNMDVENDIIEHAGNEGLKEMKKERFPDEEKKKSAKWEKVKVEKKNTDAENGKMEKKKNTVVENGKVKNGEVKGIQGLEAILKNLKRNTFRSWEITDLSIPLPEGSTLTAVAGLELAAEDIGPALQFLEFCLAFKKVLGLKKGQAENVLRELSRGPVGRRGLPSIIALFHIKLLSIILKDIGEKPPSSTAANDGLWLQALGNCFNRSPFRLKKIPTGVFSKGIAGYNSLDFSEKLRVLNFLCDEALVTGELRCCIDEENAKFIERKKEDKENTLAAKEEKRSLKQKLKDELAQAVLSWRTNIKTLTIYEHSKLVSEIREKTEQIHARLQDSVEMTPTKKQRSDAVRTEPALLEGSGKAFWRLKCCEGSSGVLLQDIGCWESFSMNDKWFTYGNEQQKVVEKHVTLARKQRLKRIKKLMRQDACSVLNEIANCNSTNAS